MTLPGFGAEAAIYQMCAKLCHAFSCKLGCVGNGCPEPDWQRTRKENLNSGATLKLSNVPRSLYNSLRYAKWGHFLVVS